MDGRPVNLHIAGQSYKVVSSASEEELHRLAETVNAKVEELTPEGRSAAPQAVLLAAMALAHELEEERARRVAVERRAKDMLRRVLGQLDEALLLADEEAAANAVARLSHSLDEASFINDEDDGEGDGESDVAQLDCASEQ